ncbi:MAG: hypothetical protein NNC22_01430 [Candidatus Nanosynbacter sp. P5B_S4_bin.39.1]|nr:hypothetical protein [Candidatus Nanosynbacter sp. P5B_S4_bin.39.1]
MLAILVGIIGMLLFGGASYATNEAQSSSGIEVASTATTGHQMTAEITRVTSSGTHVTSSVRVDGTWATEKLEIGQSFSVHANVDLKWATNFPFVLDGGERIGDCTVDNTALTCTVDTVPDTMVNKTNVTGHWWSAARIQESAVGKTTAEFILEGKTSTVTFGDSNGDGTCDRDCGPVHYSYVTADNFKAGWLNADGSTSWMISWLVEPGTEYTVHDFNTHLSSDVDCAKGNTWDPNTTIKVKATKVDDSTIKLTAPSDAKVCVTYTPEKMVPPAGAKSVTNMASVNGTKYESSVEIKASGGTDGDGTTTPEPTPSTTPSPTPSVTPAPSPTPTATPTPEPTPSTPSVTPEPTPSPTPSTTPSTPTPSPSATPTPSPSTTPTRRPVPLPTPVIERYKEPTPSAIPTPAPQHKKLAVTGTSGDVVTSAVALVALGGFLIWARRRQTAHSER